MRKFLIEHWLKKHGLLWEAKTRILAWYVGSMALFVGISIPIYTKLAVNQVDRRVEEDLLEEIEVFEETFIEASDREIDAIFDRYLRYKIPGDKTFLIATIDGEFYRSSPIGLPPTLAPNSPLLKNLAQTTKPLKGSNVVTDPEAGEIFYKAEPVEIDGRVRGVAIVANIPQGERNEVFATILMVNKVLFAAFILAITLAWSITGRILRPIQATIVTAKAIGERDLSQRILVRSRGEIGELAKTFNSMMDRVETAFNSQRQFLNDASHELRTPITIIRGHLELLDYQDPDDIAETMPLVLDELDRMGRFVEDLLLLAKSERTDFLVLETVELNELTQEMYLKMQGLGRRQWQLDGRGKGMVTIDRQRIIQAVMNLAQNAVQFTSETETIALGSSIENEQIRIWVRDTGVGIPDRDRETIFQRFKRSSNSNSSQGAGLGLSIVSAIAKNHNGRVELYSQMGKGSTFKIILPRNPR